MADGHLGKCKECTKKDSKARRNLKLATDPEWVEAEMERCRVKSRNDPREMTSEQESEKRIKYRRKYPEKLRAHKLVQNAVKSGKLVRLPCVVCGNSRSDGHHEDYDKPLEIVWLCPKHHNERHVEIRRQARLAKRAKINSPS